MSAAIQGVAEALRADLVCRVSAVNFLCIFYYEEFASERNQCAALPGLPRISVAIFGRDSTASWVRKGFDAFVEARVVDARVYPRCFDRRRCFDHPRCFDCIDSASG
jgi:hypothetical protein